MNAGSLLHRLVIARTSVFQFSGQGLKSNSVHEVIGSFPNTNPPTIMMFSPLQVIENVRLLLKCSS